ncbi:MAG TPA: FAD-dependent oxidoreductase [Steroidobacteraceae bacterium]
MRVAVIGAGISGMVAAYHLCREHEVTVFEAAPYAGGHTHTVEVESQGARFAIDTGFIVHNEWTYPNFVALLKELEVRSSDTAMSFSVHCEQSGLEYNGTSMNGLFAQRINLLKPSFLRMVSDILRFNREAQALLRGGSDLSLGEFLHRQRYSPSFLKHYILPMGAAIWSSDEADILNFPAEFFLRFFANHGFLSVNERPMWRVIDGGSQAYVKPLTAPYRQRLRLATPVASIERRAHQVNLRLKDGSVEHVDRLILACHSDEALRLLDDPSAAERAILGAIPYQRNEVLLHTDSRLLPRSRRAWAAWNYHLPRIPAGKATVTYNMNILQHLDSEEQFLVSLNVSERVEASRVLGRYVYHHPVFSPAALAAQKRRGEIDGANRTYFCGAYWGYGFHEDGVASALACLETFRREAHAKPHLQRVG